jgi:acyl-CoA dehydrogenase
MQFADIGVSEEQIQLLDIASEFCRDRAGMDRTRALTGSDSGFDADVWREMAELGWLGIAVPEALGGVGLSLAEVVPVVEQMGRHLVPSPFVATSLAAQALIAGGSDTQKAEWLPRIVGGAVATLALAEAHGDWDVTHIEAVAERTADGFALSGEKTFVLWADSAEVIVASVRVDGAPALLMLKASDIPAGALRREAIVDETKRSFAIRLDGIIVPADALLSAGDAAQVLEQLDLAAALLQSAEMCGGTQGVISYTLDYLRTRKQFGKVIGEYQALKHPMVDAYSTYEKARSHLYSAAHSFGDQGRGEIAVRMAKASADTAYSFAADRAIQFHGGFGFTHDCDAGLHRRAAIFQASQFGDAAWHREKLADLLL